MRTRQALAIVVAGLAIAVPPVAVARDTVDPIVSSYARDLGISTAAAVSNLSAQDQLGQLNATLLAAESETYAGMWLEHGADGVKAVTFFTSDPGKTLGPYLQSAELSGSIKARTAKRSLADLERDANDFRSRFGTVPFDLELAPVSDRVLHGARDPRTQRQLAPDDAPLGAEVGADAIGQPLVRTARAGSALARFGQQAQTRFGHAQRL